jgi:hypothetical protein
MSELYRHGVLYVNKQITVKNKAEKVPENFKFYFERNYTKDDAQMSLVDDTKIDNENNKSDVTETTIGEYAKQNYKVLYKAFRNNFHSDQSIGGFYVMPKENGISELKERLNSTKDNRYYYPETINQLFNDRQLPNIMYDKVFRLDSRQIKTTSLGWLNNPNKFMTERLPIHLKNWEIIKQLND